MSRTYEFDYTHKTLGRLSVSGAIEDSDPSVGIMGYGFEVCDVRLPNGEEVVLPDEDLADISLHGSELLNRNGPPGHDDPDDWEREHHDHDGPTLGDPTK